MTENDPDRPVTLVTALSPFEAHTIVSVLEGAGIPAHAMDHLTAVLPIDGVARGVPVQVRAADLAMAQAVLQANVADSVDLDWDEVDVGAREDDLPMTSPGHVPTAARIAFIVAVIVVIVSVLAGALAVVL